MPLRQEEFGLLEMSILLIIVVEEFLDWIASIIYTCLIYLQLLFSNEAVMILIMMNWLIGCEQKNELVTGKMKMELERSTAGASFAKVKALLNEVVCTLL